MDKTFDKVEADDFCRITCDLLPHQQIEKALIQLGGNGLEGMEFMAQALKAAGWKYERLTTFTTHPEVAATAFNRIARALAGSDTREALLAAVSEADA
ncbi:hypothetical protein QVG61_13140 [Thiohalobacter sp. IOR34]|uniref:hypothetical protein n=1 Tax=Thiohalobacter sp. IOR34 TaxID=3057176 RepID=UPI0025AF24CD|nr:hypothetical protein [Thiohalobacter sp. IOR34]WJW75415.1 hypothetical protein QVG61_13140 [Thiohalobacter sp. IOR34]